MWLLYFSNAFEASLSTNLTPFVTSTFNDHSLMSVINVVTQVLTGATYMPVAKILNLWDRIAGFSLMLFIAILGMILMAATNSFELYAASNVSSHRHSIHSHSFSLTAYSEVPLLDRFHRYDFLC